jgi:peptidoglycan hydrolase-like protein with peptidoglycan-binding domain
VTLAARLIAIAALILAISLPGAAAASSTSLRYDEWSSAGIVLTQGQSSNTVGFWQNLVKSWYTPLCVDGLFGNQTWIHTHGFQTNVAKVTADGIVGPQTWNGTQYATARAGFRRLQQIADEGWSYYGGSASSSYLVKRTWNGVYQWGFRKPQAESGATHSSQTTTRTVSGC